METTTKPEAVTIRSFSDRPNTYTHTHTHGLFFSCSERTASDTYERGGTNGIQNTAVVVRRHLFVLRICGWDLVDEQLLLGQCGLEGMNKNKRPFLVLSLSRVFCIDYDIVSFSDSLTLD